MADASLLVINNEPFEFRDTLNEGIHYSRSKSTYRFKLLRTIRYFLKKPKLLLLSKCVIGFVFVSLPIFCVIASVLYHSFTLLPLILSESISIAIVLFLFLQKLYDDNKYSMNISPYWVRKAYYDMFHFIFVHAFILWIVVAIHHFDLYLNGLNIRYDNSSMGRELKGCIIIKLILILKYHDKYTEERSIYVGKYSSDLGDFFYEVQNQAQFICVPILILCFIMLGKSILIKIKFTLYYIGIVLMIGLSCGLFILDHYYLYYRQHYSEWFNYLHIIPLIIALMSYACLLWKIINEGIKKKKIYDYGDKRPLYVAKVTVKALFCCSFLGCFCIIVSLICFLIIPIKSIYSYLIPIPLRLEEFTYNKIETAEFLILGGIGAIALGAVFLMGNMVLAMLFKPISKEYGRKKLTSPFCIHYTLKSNKKVKTMKVFLKTAT